MYFGPQSILLALDVQFQAGLSAGEVTAAVDRMEKSIRSAYPNTHRIFIEAESLVQTGGKAQVTGRGAIAGAGPFG
jgi:divalent metal cation (Fe/Co/Zn/Cd) transporter